MAFDEAQRTWIGKITGGFNTDAVDYAEIATRMEKKREKLDKLMLEVEALREELKEANDDLTVEWEDDDEANFWTKKKKEMQWMTGDRDEEIDTVHDLKGKYVVDPDKARRVTEAHAKLIAIQKKMEEAKDEEGNDLFTAKDIERELWSPLVRADVIPSNAVADKYSQEAQVWNGACKLYEEKLTDYTKTASKYDGVQRGIRIGQATVSMVGTVAMESVKAANFEAMSISREDTQDYKDLTKDGAPLKDVKASDVPTDPVERAKFAQEKGVTGDQLDFFTNHSDKLEKANAANEKIAYTQLAVGLINGGLGIADAALDKPSKKKGWAVGEKIYDAVAKAATDSIAAAMATVKSDNPTLASDDNYKTMMGQITNLTNYGFKAGKLVFRAAELGEAYANGDSAGAKKAAFAMVASVAGAIGNAVAAFDRAGAPEDGGTDGVYTRTGAYIEAGILAAANTGKIVAEIVDAKRNGREVNITAIVAACGLTAIGPVMAGTYDPLAEITREDTSGETLGVFKESPEEKEARLKKLNGAIAKAGGKSCDPSQMLSLFQGGLTDEAAMKAKLAEEVAEEEEKLRKTELTAFQKSLEDEETRRQFVDKIKREADLSAGALEKLMEDAKPSVDDLEDEAKAKKAMEAMEKLIAEAAALNAKWDMVNSLTGGATSILVAALPVAGLAAAIQKLVMDVAILLRKSVELNKWFDNMALTYGNSSVYGPAIAGRLASAKVQVSQASVMAVFSAVGVVSESMKLADMTGISTALSIGNNMARALTEWGYKMAKEAECQAGWQLYKNARANPGDRKLARKAMKWNSTLSKCVLAYGIVMDGDPIAKEVARSCGMTPEVLADQKDVCQKVVTYFETLYSDDAVILRRIPLTKDWHPGMPYLAFDSWVRFKAAAASRAKPPIADASTKTPVIDGCFSRLRDTVGMDGNYTDRRDKKWPEYDPALTDEDPHKGSPAYREWMDGIIRDLETLMTAFSSYSPVTGPCPEDEEEKWTAGLRHAGMLDVADSYAAQAAMMKGEIEYDILQYEAVRKTIAGKAQLRQAQLLAIDQQLESTETTETSDTTENTEETEE
ncbi:MAG: hypothetical protein AAGC57_17320 [Pseudomonadota bacterium]